MTEGNLKDIKEDGYLSA